MATRTEHPGHDAARVALDFGHGHARHVRQAHDGVLPNALEHQFFHLCILRRFARGGRRKHSLVSASRAQVLGFALARAVLAHGATATFGAGQRCLDHTSCTAKSAFKPPP